MKRIIQIIFLFEIMSLFALMFLFVFVSPSADDFCFASIINNNNWFESQIHWYNNWFGRYFSTMMATTILGTNSLFAYRAILFVIIFLHVPAVYLLFNSLSDKKNCHIIFVVSIFFVFLYFSGMPGMTEGVYWFLGTVTYSWANLALMFFIISIKYFYDTKNRKICFFLATVSGFMVIGSNEVAMLLLLIVSSALLLRDIKNIYLWWLFSIFLLLASFVVL